MSTPSCSDCAISVREQWKLSDSYVVLSGPSNSSSETGSPSDAFSSSSKATPFSIKLASLKMRTDVARLPGSTCFATDCHTAPVYTASAHGLSSEPR